MTNTEYSEDIYERLVDAMDALPMDLREHPPGWNCA